MISVIVPVYNTEKYLHKCVDSILSQSYKDFELILVNDGSTDRSGDICDEYAQKDTRVKVLHRKNGGPSVARNEAAKEAAGDFISFVDSDDYVAREYLQTLLDCSREYDADISAVKMTELNENETSPEIKVGDIVSLSGREALLNVLYQKDLDTTPCGMLFKKKIVLDNPFPIGRFHEDDFTMFKYFEQADRVVLNQTIMYFYIQHESSIMHRKSLIIVKDEIDASDNLETCFQEDSELLRAAKSKKFSNYCQIVLNNPNLRTNEATYYRKICEYLKNEKINILRDRNTRLKNKVAACILIFGVNFFEVVGKML